MSSLSCNHVCQVSQLALFSAANIPATLQANKSVLNQTQWKAAEMLCGCGQVKSAPWRRFSTPLAEQLSFLFQEHLFEDWPAAGTDDAQKQKFLDEMAKLDKLYAGGLAVSWRRETALQRILCFINSEL